MSYPRFIISVLVAGLTTHIWDTFENTWNFFCRWCFALLSFPLQNCLRTVKFTLDVFMTLFCLHSWYWCMWSLFLMHWFLHLSVSVPFSDKLEHRKFSDCTYMAIQTFPSWGKLVWWWLLSICVTRASMNWGCVRTCVCMCVCTCVLWVRVYATWSVKRIHFCFWTNGVYSSLFRAQASGGHSKARETRDAQLMQKFTRFALLGLGPAQPRVCECPPPQIPVSQSPF